MHIIISTTIGARQLKPGTFVLLIHNRFTLHKFSSSIDAINPTMQAEFLVRTSLDIKKFEIPATVSVCLLSV